MIWIFLACAKKGELPRQSIVVDGTPIEVEIADDDKERAKGLMYRDSMPTDEGMLFVYPDAEERGFWMMNTRIPLSIAYLDATGRVMNIEDMIPYDTTPVPSAGPAMYALEMNQGWFKAHGVEPGDVVTGLPGPSKE